MLGISGEEGEVTSRRWPSVPGHITWCRWEGMREGREPPKKTGACTVHLLKVREEKRKSARGKNIYRRFPRTGRERERERGSDDFSWSCTKLSSTFTEAGWAKHTQGRKIPTILQLALVLQIMLDAKTSKCVSTTTFITKLKIFLVVLTFCYMFTSLLAVSKLTFSYLSARSFLAVF